MADPVQFFKVPDASFVTFAHAVNSRVSLLEALQNDKIMMLEADVNVKNLVPVMSHSCDDTSDVTLGEWLQLAITNGKKGLKLDFKSKEAAEAAVPVLTEYRDLLWTVPVWFNADIISNGPINSTVIAVDAKAFLKIGEEFPQSTLSIGWTTNFPGTYNGGVGYTWEHVFEMFEIVTVNSAVDSLQAVTFPVRAGFIFRSPKQLQWLLDVFGAKKEKASLSLWTNSADVDYTTVADILEFRTQFPASAIYYDLLDKPVQQNKEFQEQKENYPPNANPTSDTDLANVIEPIPKADAYLQHYMGSHAVILKNGHGFRTKAEYARSSTDRFEFKADVYFSQNSPIEGRFTIVLRPGLAPGTLQFAVQRNGLVTLTELIRNSSIGTGTCSGVSNFDGLGWSDPVWTSTDLGILDGEFTITARDDLVGEKAIFMVSSNGCDVTGSRGWISGEVPMDPRNFATVHCDSLPVTSFVVVTDVSVTVASADSTN